MSGKKSADNLKEFIKKLQEILRIVNKVLK